MIKTLKQRLTILLILPVAALLLFAGVTGFVYVRNTLLDEWRESAILKLERAAHQIDMRLSRPVDWIDMFHKSANSGGRSMDRDWLLDQLKNQEGVTRVDVKWLEPRFEPDHRMMSGHPKDAGGMMQFHQGRILEVTAPRYDAQAKQKTVTLISDLKDASGRLVGRLEVSLGFDFLMQDIKKYGWWQSDMACLIDESGRYLAHSGAMKGRIRLGETGDPVELAILKNMRVEPYGTHLGGGHPPKLVSGFYRLKEAPWVIAMFAPGEKILTPIVEFRYYYLIAGGLCVVIILLLIRLVGGQMVRSIHTLSKAAEQVAEGHYGDPLPRKTADEIGQLTDNFNAMVRGLKERDFIRDTFGRYMDPEVARELIQHPEAGRLGGEKRDVAVLMSDIRGFTPISERLTPEETITMLNHYFSHMIEVIQKHKGIIVDFYGDGVLVFFDPLEGPIQPTVQRAVRCSLDMQWNMAVFNTEMKAENLPELQTGIGVNLGQVVVGNIGSATRAKYGIVGSAVNITHRIQSEAKGGDVIISNSVYETMKNNLKIKKSFTAHLKGVQEEMTLYIVEDIND
jgi:class 3 adenylate cyclase